MAREAAGPDRDELREVLRLVSTEAERYLAELDDSRVRMAEADEAAESVGGDLLEKETARWPPSPSCSGTPPA